MKRIHHFRITTLAWLAIILAGWIWFGLIAPKMPDYPEWLYRYVTTR